MKLLMKFGRGELYVLDKNNKKERERLSNLIYKAKVDVPKPETALRLGNIVLWATEEPDTPV